MSQPLVSIIVPNYNHASFLKERLESIFNQTYQNFEVILLDDASTDDSVAFLEKHQNHPKVTHFVRNRENSESLFEQWIKGLQLAKGKYIWIAESDDFAHVDFLKETVKIAEQEADIGFVFTDSVIVNQSGEFLKKASESNKKLSKFKEVKSHRITDRSKVLEYFVSDLIIYNASSVLFRKNTITDVDFNVLSSLKNAGDLFAYISIALKHDIVYINQPLNYFRSHEDNTTKKNAMSGLLFSDRQTIITYFIKQFQELQGSKKHLKSFFSRNFLTAVDFKLYNKVSTLLKAYYTFKIISLGIYIRLSFYICYSKVFRKTPYKYRMYIKKVLAK